MRVVILNAGEGKRWECETGRKFPDAALLKQLSIVWGETVIARQFRQLRERGIEPVLVTHRQELIDEARAVHVLVPARRRWTIESLLSSRDVWSDYTVVLLGDVVFSDWALDTVLGTNGAVRFFGWYGDQIKPREIYACSFDSESAKQIQELAEGIIEEIAPQPNAPRFGGKMQDLYGCMILGGLDGFRVGLVGPVPPVWVWLPDWTDDVDSPMSLERIFENVSAL